MQAAADPNVSSPGSVSDTLHRRSTGIREGSFGILCFGRRLTVLHPADRLFNCSAGAAEQVCGWHKRDGTGTARDDGGTIGGDYMDLYLHA